MNMMNRSKLSAFAVALAVLFPQTSQAVQLKIAQRNIVAGDAIFLSVSENGGNPATGRGQIVSVDSTGVRIRATLINGTTISRQVSMSGLTASGGSIPNCVATVTGPLPKSPRDALCPTTAVRYVVSVMVGGL